MVSTVICYLRGTNIRISEGERKIEGLKISDVVYTLSGESKPIKWIGRQHFKKDAGSDWPKALLPVRVSRFALDDHTPHRDLYLSPNHALLLDGVLIPAIYLVNGTSIVQAMPEGVEDIEYFHIELETHEVIFAEGAAAETLLVMNDREAFADLIREKFDNFSERKRLYGRDDAPPMTPCAPRVCYNGRRSELKALLRRAASPVVDIRDPIQLVHDRIAARATEGRAIL
jgi:Hint domain